VESAGGAVLVQTANGGKLGVSGLLVLSTGTSSSGHAYRYTHGRERERWSEEGEKER
jgi:hypothetical protein